MYSKVTPYSFVGNIKCTEDINILCLLYWYRQEPLYNNHSKAILNTYIILKIPVGWSGNDPNFSQVIY